MGITTTSLTHLHASLFDSVRRIRAEALDLLETTDQIITILNDTSLKENDAQMRKERALTIGNKIISEHGPQVQKYFEAINSLLAQHPELNVQSGEDVSSDITIMHDEWEKALWNWPDTTQGNLPSNQELLFQLGEVKESIYTLGVRAQILTFPDLVNQRLQDMHTGEQLDFFHEFSDEFYKPEFLKVAWQYLREHPHRINGFMTENGIIYRASSLVPRFLSSILVAGIVGSGFLLIWLASVLNYFPLPAVDVLFRGYIALMAGGLVHTFVDVWKQYQTKPDHATNMLGNWVLWVHVKQVTIVSGILTLWAGFVILIAIQQIGDAGAAFFAGYSIDSFIGLFLVRFTDTTSQSVGRWGSQNAPKSTRQQVTDVLAQSAKSSSLAH
jgi:hypothetical protein